MPPIVEQLISQMEWVASRRVSHLVVTLNGSQVTILREASPAAQPAVASPAEPPVGAVAPDATVGSVTAPLAGLCHLAAEVGGAPFVRPGQTVEAGQILCLIEAMKVMTQVTAPTGGSISEILVADGGSVDAGTPLMRIA